MSGINFLRQLSEGSAATYRSGIRALMRSVYGRDFENSELEEATSRYPTEKRNFEADIEDFFTHLKNSNTSPKGTKLYISVAKTYLLENNIELPELFWRKLRQRTKGSRPLTMDRAPTNAELKQIINNAPIVGKALFSLLATSGMRVGEALQLKPEDLILESDPVKVLVRPRYTKNGNPRITYISQESKEFVQQWIRTRPQYMQTAKGRSRYSKNMDDPRLFPFENITAMTIWNNAVKKSKLDQKDPTTERLILHIHSLRKFFRSKLGKYSQDATETLMGHEGYLSSSYRRIEEEDLSKFYKEHESELLIYGDGQELAKLKNEVEEKNRTFNEGMATLALKNADLENRLTALIAENQDLRGRLKTVEEAVKDLKKIVNG
jgi:integrase